MYVTIINTLKKRLGISDPCKRLADELFVLQERKQEENNELIPEDKIFDDEYWDVGETAALCRNIGLKTRNAGRELSKGSMLANLRALKKGNVIVNAFEPAPFGITWQQYWLPIIGNACWSIIIVICSLAFIHVLYRGTEYYHSRMECHYFLNAYNIQCYSIKAVRSKLETLNYNVVQTAFVSLSAFALVKADAFLGLIKRNM